MVCECVLNGLLCPHTWPFPSLPRLPRTNPSSPTTGIWSKPSRCRMSMVSPHVTDGRTVSGNFCGSDVTGSGVHLPQAACIAGSTALRP